MTWQLVLLEWQRDCEKHTIHDAVMAMMKEHFGTCGMGVNSAYTIVHKPRARRLGLTLAPVATV